MYPNGDNGLTSLMYVGAPWMDSFKKMPDNAKFELQIPLERENKTNGIEFLKAALNAMGQDNLYAIEIGNEPNLYPAPSKGHPYTVDEYVKAVLDYEESIVAAVPSLKQPVFRGLDYASGDNLDGEFSLSNAFKAGLNNKDRIKEISLHYYQTHGGANLANDLLSPSATQKDTDRFKSSIAYLSKNNPTIPLILGEIGDILGKTPNGQKDLTLSASLGAAVWTANWMLYCMTIGIDRIETQLVHGSQFSPWQPITNKSHDTTAGVTGPFYGMLMIADLVESAGKGLKVAQFNSGNDRVTAYGAYNGGDLSSVMVFNTELWTPDDKTTRPSQSVSLKVPKGASKVTVKRLAGDGGEELVKMSWAGQRWEYPSGMPTTVGSTSDTLTPKNGVVSVDVPATEGAMVIFG